MTKSNAVRPDTAAKRRLRIVHLTTVHQPFDTRIFHRECRTLAQNGYEVILIAPGREDRLVDGVHLMAVEPPASRGERFRKTWRKVLSSALSARADLYHFHDPELIPVGIVLKILGKRVVYDVHEDVPLQMRHKHWLPPRLSRLLAGLANVLEGVASATVDGIIAATPSIAQNFPKGKSIVVQNFPDLSEFHLQTQTSVSQTFVYVGAVAAIRGAREIAMATRIVRETHSGARLRILGPIHPDALATELEEIGGQGVILQGWADRRQVEEALATACAGLVVLHATSNYLESYPVKLFEYMSVGLPVIASNFPLWREIVEGAGCGILVEPTNCLQIAAAMKWILDNPFEATQLGERGRRAAQNRYNWATEAEKLLQFYRRVLATTV